jgi:HNH endonuclease
MPAAPPRVGLTQALALCMSITDKSRKVLWGRSGSLCAFCRAHLVIDASAVDSESIVGDECHIISGAPNGPRHDQNLGPEEIDSLDNLLLLCRVHHKLVDDQPETFSADTLRQLKANHERWVKGRLIEENQQEPVRIVRNSSEIPKHLTLITSAKTLLNLSSGCHGNYYDYPDDLTEIDLDCVGEFLQNLTDWVDLGLNEPKDKIIAQKSIAEDISALDHAGLRVYAAQEKQQLHTGTTTPSPFYVLHLLIVRRDDPNQVQLATPAEG